MVTLQNRQQNGHFEYTNNGVTANGNYNASYDGTMRNLYANFQQQGTPIGGASVDYGDGQPNINISGTGIAGMIVIAQNIEALCTQLAEAIAEPGVTEATE